MPTAYTVRHLTSCYDNAPNGWVTADVNGQTFNYTFNWTNGPSEVDWLDRPIGVYEVTATDQLTGCTSPKDTAEVKDMRTYPKLSLASTPSYCEDTNRGGTGSVLLTVINNTEVVLEVMNWTNLAGNPVGIGNQVLDLYPDTYFVNVLTTEGCPGEGKVEVETEILAYNLVSVNNDGNNDGWIIDCIGLFLNNNVKIFNRAGVLVYEANGYNNGEIIFKGLGEKGIYMTGNSLPDGTYFYIIDKRNGTKPIVGYLELVR
jgi:gliding motility-associated-like protein